MWNSGQRSRRLSQRSGLVAAVGVLSILGVFLGGFGVGQIFAQESDRKVLSRVEPDYPDALKKLYIGGVVRVEVEVAPNGAVRNVKLLGGNPILGQSTMKAVKMWKYAPAPVDELITVKLNFDPHK